MIIHNPFKSKMRADKPNRNAFDLSHAVNFTSQFGKLYPILCKEVVPGDSFNIKATMGLRLMPLAFPVQSRMRADVHYFYVRNRNLWKDWMDFIGDTKKGLVPPYIQRASGAGQDIFGTGTLGDYLGVPTTVASSLTGVYSSPMASVLNFGQMNGDMDYSSQYTGGEIPRVVPEGAYGFTTAKACPTLTETAFVLKFIGSSTLANRLVGGTGTLIDVMHSFTIMPLVKTVQQTSQLELVFASGNPLPNRIYFFEKHKNGEAILGGYTSTSPTFALSGGIYRSLPFSGITVKNVFLNGKTQNMADYINEVIQTRHCQIIMMFECPAVLDNSNPKDTTSPTKYNNIFNGVRLTNISSPTLIEITQSSYCPYTGTNPTIRVSALPFRAYESIYNSFYRNNQVDPFKIGGNVEYNKFVTNDAGGADTTPYILQNKNWELDFLTSALLSPQQGIAPLVGARVASDSQGVNYNLSATIDGVKKDIVVTAGGSGDLAAVSYYGNDVPESVIKALNSDINLGISINDFRNVNSLQRWLEKNVRNGFRYKDQIKSHFGVDIRFDVLNMPEFIGGFTQDIQVNSISQTVQTDSNPLGAYAGQGHAFGGSKHDVNHYFDEHGFVIAILSISPIPSYSQLLPKHMLKNSCLDYYTPEFGHIGLQPIPMKEVTPNEVALLGDPKQQDAIFGYQRPYYDYLASVDTVHGQVRTTLRDFLINRYFEVPPQLSPAFLKIDSEEVNDIFTVTDDTNDKIIGQVYFNIVAKRPISRFAEPRLE